MNDKLIVYLWNRKAYQTIVDQHKIDTIILVDGGTDSLMTGNESGLGTPTEGNIVSIIYS